MITENEAIELLNQAAITDIIEVNQEMNNEVLIAPIAHNDQDGVTLDPQQRADLTEFLNSSSANDGLSMNINLTGVAIAQKNPCD